jgi:hypothetical protein
MNHFVEVVESVDSFDSLSDVERSLIAILLFATLWSGGLIYICIQAGKSHLPSGGANSKVTRIQNEVKEDRNGSKRDRTKIALTQYIDEVFPTVFQTKSAFARLTIEVTKHHRYLTLFLGDRHTTDRQRRLICLQMLTVQSMLMFMLAALYEVQVFTIKLPMFFFSSRTFIMMHDVCLYVCICSVRMNPTAHIVRLA